MKLKMKSKVIAVVVSLAMAFTMMPMMGATVYAEEEQSVQFSTCYGNYGPDSPKPGPHTFSGYGVRPFAVYGEHTTPVGIELSNKDNYFATIRLDGSASELLTITKVECIGHGDFSKLTSTEGEISVDEYETGSEKSIATITGENGAHLDVSGLDLSAAEGAAEPIKITDMKIYYIDYKAYDLWVGDTQVTGRNLDDVLAGDPVNGGKVSYEPSEDGKSGILTLSGARITKCAEGKYSNIRSNDIDLTIVLKGENKVGDAEGPVNSAITVDGMIRSSLVITGEGSLTANGEYYGINTGRTVTISGVTIDAKGNSAGIYAGSSPVTIKGSKVTASGKNHAIQYKVKSDVAGTGWTVEDGSRGRTEIGVSEDPQDLKGYKILMFPKAPYDIAVFPAENGIVMSDKEGAHEGETVTLTAALDKGYKLKEISVAAPMKEIDSVRDLVTVMGDAEFKGTRKGAPGTDDTECALKISEDTFCIFDNNGTMLDKLDKDARFIPGPGGEYEVSKDRSFWRFIVKYGKLVKVEHLDRNAELSYDFTGKSNGSLPKETIATKAVKEGEKYTFTMPAANVEVSAEFEPVPPAPTPVPPTPTPVPPTPTPVPPAPTPVPPAPKISGTPLAKATVKNKSMTIGWNKIQGAEGYDIFFATCTKHDKASACKNVKTIKSNKTFKWTKSGLKKGTAYKFYVRAYVKKNGKKTYVSKSPLFHAYTGNGTKKYTNAKSVTIKNVKKGKLSLKKGKTFKIKAKVNKVNKKKKLMPKSHAPALRYMTTNKKVATVTKSGKITAKGKGTCYIYVYAHNGVSKQVKVMVK